MKWLGGNAILGILRETRTLTVSGFTNAGKTSFCVALAEHYAKNFGYRVVATMPLVFAENPDDIHLMDDGMAHVFIILDEAGVWLESVDVKAFRAFLAKLDIIIVLPSFEDVPRGFRKQELEAGINFGKVGLPIIEYRWIVKRSTKDDIGKLVWLDSRSAWGKYSRQFPAMHAGGIDRMIDRLVRELAEKHGENQDANTDNFSFIKQQNPETAAILDAASAMEAAAERLERVQAKTKTKKRRRFPF